MSSGIRNDNAFAKVKGKNSLSKNLDKLLKNAKSQVNTAQEKLADKLEALADKENGVFDNEELTVSFGSSEDNVTVYGSLDKESNEIYQALHRSSNPTIFIAGEPERSFEEAVNSLVNKYN